MTSPTKGPWTYNRLGNIRSPKHVLAQMPPNLYFVEGMTEAEIDANGYLMAAAPTMKDALELALSALRQLIQPDHALGKDPAISAVEDAIAKAENRT